jgi:hypothetical protein
VQQPHVGFAYTVINGALENDWECTAAKADSTKTIAAAVAHS